MKSLYSFKPRFQIILRPMSRFLAQNGITANHITIGAIAIALVAGGILYWQKAATWSLLLVAASLLIRMALNAIDGILAREHNMKSNLGVLLNECGDVISDAAMYLPFAVIPGFSAKLVVLIVVLRIISEMAGLMGLIIGASRRYDGPMGKSDRAFAFGLMALLLGFGILPSSWITTILTVILLLLGITIFNRAKNALREAA